MLPTSRQSVFDVLAFWVVVACALLPVLLAILPPPLYLANAGQGILPPSDSWHPLMRIFRQYASESTTNRLFFDLTSAGLSPLTLAVSGLGALCAVLFLAIKQTKQSFATAMMPLSVLLLCWLKTSTYLPLHGFIGLPLLFAWVYLSLQPKKIMALLGVVALFLLPMASVECAVVALLMVPFVLTRALLQRTWLYGGALCLSAFLTAVILTQANVWATLGQASLSANLSLWSPDILLNYNSFSASTFSKILVIMLLAFFSIRALVMRILYIGLRPHTTDNWLLLALTALLALALLPAGSGMVALSVGLLAYGVWLACAPAPHVVLQRLISAVCMVLASGLLGQQLPKRQQMQNVVQTITSQLAQTDTADALYMFEPSGLWQQPQRYGALAFVQSGVRQWLVQQNRLEASPPALFLNATQRLWHDNPPLQAIGPMPWQPLPPTLQNRKFAIVLAGNLAPLPHSVNAAYYSSFSHTLPYQILLPKPAEPTPVPAVVIPANEPKSEPKPAPVAKKKRKKQP